MKEYNDNNVGQNGYKEDEDWSFIGFEELAKESREALKKDDEYKYSSNPVIEDYYKSIEEENKQAYKDYIDKGTLNDDQVEMLTDMMDGDTWKAYYSTEAGEAVAINI